MNNNITNSATCTLQVDGFSQKVILFEKNGKIKGGYLVTDPSEKVYPYQQTESGGLKYSPCPAIYSSLKRHRVWMTEGRAFKYMQKRDYEIIEE